ncbi:hypothetical protein KKA47_05290 [bacterium]|nr:hypothetical protein [bacterium]
MFLESYNDSSSELASFGNPPLPPPPSFPEDKAAPGPTKREILLKNLTLNDSNDENSFEFTEDSGDIPPQELEVIKKFLNRQSQKSENEYVSLLHQRDEEMNNRVVIPRKTKQPVRSKALNALTLIAVFVLMFTAHYVFKQIILDIAPDKETISSGPVAIPNGEIEIGEGEVVIKAPLKSSASVESTEEMVVAPNEIAKGTTATPEPTVEAKTSTVPAIAKEEGSDSPYHDTYTSGGSIDVDNEEVREQYLSTNKIVTIKDPNKLPSADEVKTEIKYPETKPIENTRITDNNTPYNAGGEFDLDGEEVRQQYLNSNTYYTKK